MRRALLGTGLAVAAVVGAGMFASPAGAVPASPMRYGVCSNDPLKFDATTRQYEVVDRRYGDPFTCDYSWVNTYNRSDRFFLPTGLDAVGKTYDVCMGTIPAVWQVQQTFNSMNCGIFNPVGNAMRIRFSGTVG